MSKQRVITKKINGSEIVLYPMQDVRSVRVECWIHAGAWYEEGDNWGRFHLLEHTMHNATQKFPNRMAMEYFEEEHGITSNAWTGQKGMGFWAHFPDNSVDEGFELLNQTIFHPLFPPSELAREVGVIEQEYKDRWSNPSFRFSKEVNYQMYGKNHLYSRDPQGPPEFMRDLTQADLKKLYHQYIIPSNMVFVVVGKISEEKAFEKVEELLAKIPAGNPSPKLEFEKIEPGSKYLFHKEDSKSVTLLLSWMIKGKDDYTLKERLAMGMGAYLLGGSPRSLLYNRLRHQLGIVYGVSARRLYFPTAGVFGISTNINSENAQQTLDEIRSVVAKFIERAPTKEEFDRAAKFMHTRWLMAYDSISSIADDLVNPLFHDGVLLTPEDYIEVAKTITPDDILLNLVEPLSSESFISVMAPEDPKLK